MKIKSTVKTLEIENLKGKKTVYSFETGDPDVLGNWQKQAQDISDNLSKLEGGELKKVYEIERDFICLVLGQKAWKQISKDCNDSVFSLFPVLAELSRLITESIEENAKAFKK